MHPPCDDVTKAHPPKEHGYDMVKHKCMPGAVASKLPPEVVDAEGFADVIARYDAAAHALQDEPPTA